MPEVDNGGVRIAYRVHGDGEPLVLVHGWSCEGRYWDEFGYVPKLSTEYRVIVPDLRGHGDSDVPGNRDFSDEAFASDVVAVLDDLGIESAHVFGYSLGGWVVFELAASFGSRFKSAIVGGAHPYEEDLSELRGIFTPAGILEAWEALDMPLSEASRERVAALDAQLLVEMAPDRIDKSARLSNLQIPWLMVCGTDDWRLEGMRSFAEGNHRCELVEIEEADHILAWIRSEQVLPAVLNFLPMMGG